MGQHNKELLEKKLSLDLVISKQHIKKWFLTEDNSEYRQWLNEQARTPIEKLRALSTTLATIGDRAWDWKDLFDPEKLVSFIFNSIALFNQELKKLQDRDGKEAVELSMTLLKHANSLIKDNLNPTSAKSLTPFDLNCLPVLLEKVRTIAEKQNVQVFADNIKSIFDFLIVAKGLVSEQVLSKSLDKLGQLAQTNELAKKHLGSINQLISVDELNPEISSHFLNGITQLVEKDMLKISAKQEMIVKLLKSISASNDYSKITDALDNIHRLFKKSAFTKHMNLDLTEFDKFFSSISQEKEQKSKKSAGEMPIKMLVNALTSLSFVCREAKKLSNSSCKISMNTIESCLEYALNDKNSTPDQIGKLLLAAGHIVEAMSGKASLKLKKLVERALEKLDNPTQASTLSLAVIAKSLYGSLLLEVIKPKLTINLRANFKERVAQEKPKPNAKTQEAYINQVAQYMDRCNDTLSKEMEKSIAKQKPAIDENSFHNRLFNHMRGLDWFKQNQMAEMEGRVGGSSWVDCLVQANIDGPDGKPRTINYSVQLHGGVHNHTKEKDDRREKTLAPNTDFVITIYHGPNTSLKAAAEEWEKQFLHKVEKLNSAETVRELEQKPTPAKNKEKIFIPQPKIKSRDEVKTKISILLPFDKNEAEESPPEEQQLMDLDLEDLKISSPELKSSKSKSFPYEVSVNGLSRAIKNKDYEAVKHLLNKQVLIKNPLSDSKKSEFLISAIKTDNQNSPKIGLILELLLKSLSSRIITTPTANEPKLSPLAVAINREQESAIKAFMDRSKGGIKGQEPPSYEEWQKALRIAKQNKQTSLESLLESAGVSLPQAKNSRPLSNELDKPGSTDNNKRKEKREMKSKISSTAFLARLDQAAKADIKYKRTIKNDQGAPNKMVERLEEAANLGSGDAELALGRLSEKENKKKAFEYFQLAVKKGCLDGYIELARCYTDGVGIDRNVGESIRLYEEAAKRGSAAADYCLGYHYLYGLGVPTDEAKGIGFMKKAIAQDHVGAKYSLAKYYLDLPITDHDKEAIKLLQSIYKTHMDARRLLAKCFGTGRGIAKSLEMGIELYKQAAEGGHHESQLHYAQFYFQGLSVKEDFARGVNLLVSYIQMGNLEAKKYLQQQLMEKFKHIQSVHPSSSATQISSNTIGDVKEKNCGKQDAVLIKQQLSLICKHGDPQLAKEAASYLAEYSKIQINTSKLLTRFGSPVHTRLPLNEITNEGILKKGADGSLIVNKPLGLITPCNLGGGH